MQHQPHWVDTLPPNRPHFTARELKLYSVLRLQPDPTPIAAMDPLEWTRHAAASYERTWAKIHALEGLDTETIARVARYDVEARKRERQGPS